MFKEAGSLHMRRTRYLLNYVDTICGNMKKIMRRLLALNSRGDSAFTMLYNSYSFALDKIKVTAFYIGFLYKVRKFEFGIVQFPDNGGACVLCVCAYNSNITYILR